MKFGDFRRNFGQLMVREKGDVYAAGWGGPWLRDSIVRFKHVATGQYLFSHRKQFNNGPVNGMNEIVCSPRADDRTLWSVEEGCVAHLRPASLCLTELMVCVAAGCSTQRAWFE